MNINNIEAAQRIKNRIGENQLAIEDISRLLAKYPNGNSCGKSNSSEGKLYNLCISEHRDGSGVRIDLTGSLVQTELLVFAKNLLEERIKNDLAVIESL